jgi:hypothetical protein
MPLVVQPVGGVFSETMVSWFTVVELSSNAE